MNVEVAPKQSDALVPTPIVHQTAFWSRVHRRLGFGIDAFDVRLAAPAAAASASGDVLVMRMPIAEEVDAAYVPFGPELEPDAGAAGAFLERLSRELRPMLGPRTAFIRWDLPWTSVYAREPGDFGPDGAWRGPPAPRLRELRMNFGTDDRNLHKAPRDLLPPDTVLVDLAPSEDAILARMHHKTRYNIRLAARRGVAVSTGTIDDLPAWYALYLETAARGRFEPLPLAHFEAMLTEQAEGSASPVQTRLVVARYRGELVAGVLVALAPPRATYLHGASSRAHREVMASHAAQWLAIRLARAQGCSEYDLFGVAPRSDPNHALDGVHRFKMGFGGRVVHREGCWDFPYDDEAYAAIRRREESHILGAAVGAGER